MRPLRIGEHRTRVWLQNPAQPETFDSFGQPIGPFVTVGPFWAFVRDLVGTELVAAKQVKERASIRVRMRLPGTVITINAASRLILNGVYFGLFDVRNVEYRFRAIEMTGYEIVQASP